MEMEQLIMRVIKHFSITKMTFFLFNITINTCLYFVLHNTFPRFPCLVVSPFLHILVPSLVNNNSERVILR